MSVSGMYPSPVEALRRVDLRDRAVGQRWLSNLHERSVKCDDTLEARQDHKPVKPANLPRMIALRNKWTLPLLRTHHNSLYPAPIGLICVEAQVLRHTCS
jgi:hypothetical protein